MGTKNRIGMSWSGGKDATLALHDLLLSGKYVLDHLHTIINSETGRVGMHGIPEQLIRSQAESLEIPLHISYLPTDSTHKAYQEVMANYADFCRSNDVYILAFGDIFLEDLKRYREQQLEQFGIECIFPLWQQKTRAVIDRFLSLGYKTIICAADSRYFLPSQVGVTLDQQWVDALSPEVDPCGENGEFHSFTFAGPLFTKPVNTVCCNLVTNNYLYKMEARGKIIEKTSTFYFADLQ